MATMNFSAGDKTIYDVEVTEVGPNAYRLDEELRLLLASEAQDEEELGDLPRYGDLIETKAGPNGTLVFVRVLERGAYRHYDAMVTQEIAESQSLELLLDEVVAEGGRWERIFGGFLYVSLPETSRMDFDARFASTDFGS